MYKFAFNNLRLKKSRTALALIGLAIAVAGMVGLISISLGIKTEVTNVISKMQGINILEKDAIDDMFSNIPVARIDDLRGLPDIRVAAPLITTMASNIEGKKKGLAIAPMAGIVSVMGVDPDENAKLEEGSLYHPRVIKGRFLSGNDENGAMLGSTVADTYNKAVGSKIEFNGMSFRVVGIFETGSMLMDNAIITHIDAVREMTGKADDVVSMIYVELKDPDKAEEVAKKINFRFDDIEAKTGSGFSEDIGSMLSMLDIFFLLISSIALIVGALGILNTMLMSVMERYRDFGVIRAVGWTGENLMRLIFFESFFIGTIGSMLGVLLGTLGVFAARTLTMFKPVVTPELLAGAFGLGIFLSVLGGLYPAFRASKLDPIEAIRYG